MSVRRPVVIAATALAATIALAGCTGTGSSASEVTYWGAFNNDVTQAFYEEHYIDAYNADAEVPVKMDVKTWATIGQLTDTAVSAGRGPDVVFAAGPSNALGFESAGRVVSMADYADEYGWADLLQPWAFEASSIDGELYSIPAEYGSIVLYYNPDVFEEHGWTPPTTLAEFEAIANEAQAADIIPIGAGNSGYQAQNEWYLSAFLNMAVGPQKLYEALTGAAKFTDPEFVRAIDLFREQIDKGWWGGGKDRWFTNTDADMLVGLADGSVAMYITGTWSFGDASNYFGPDGTWDWVGLPSFSDDVQPGIYPMAIGTSLAINAATKNADAAAAFLDSIINDPKKSYAYFAATGQNPPPLVNTDIPADADERAARLYIEAPESGNLGYASWTFFPSATDAYLWAEFDKIIVGTLSTEDYLAGLQEVFDGEFAAGKVITPFVPNAG